MEMDSKEAGFYWHVHHDIFVEWCYNYAERVKYIRDEKAKSERELRLRLFKPVKGSLPQEVVEAQQAYTQAQQAYYQAQQAYDQAQQAYDQAKQAYYQAQQAYNQALVDNKSKIENLHKAECLNCPWDGNTIFP